MKRMVLALCLFSLLFSLPLIPSALHHISPINVVYADDPPPDVGKGACAFIKGPENGACTDCFNGGGAWTAVGCVGEGSNWDPTKQLGDFIHTMLQLGIGMGGGIAFLLILFSGFQTIVSAGNPEKLHAAKELMTAAISGLLLIIFSVFLLKLIGLDILGVFANTKGGAPKVGL